MQPHDLGQNLRFRKADVVEETAAQKRVRQFLFVVRSDDDHRPVDRAHRLAGLVDVKLHPVEFLQKVVWKLDIGLVDLVDQQHHAGRGVERLPEFALLDIVAHLMHPRLAQLAVAQAADGVIFVKTLLCFGCGFYVPLNQGHIQGCRHLTRKLGLSGARLALHQERALQRDGSIDGNRKVIGGDIGRGGGKFHNRIKALRLCLATS